MDQQQATVRVAEQALRVVSPDRGCLSSDRNPLYPAVWTLTLDADPTDPAKPAVELTVADDEFQAVIGDSHYWLHDGRDGQPPEHLYAFLVAALQQDWRAMRRALRQRD